MIEKIMRQIKEGARQVSGDLNIPNIYFEESRREDGSPFLMPLIALRSNPCISFSNSGGCAMCGYQLAASLSQSPTDSNLINQTKYAIQTLPAETYPLITFNSAGSFLDTKEINDELRPKLLGMLRDAGYKEFNFECRPDFLLNQKRVAQLREYFDIVSVGTGLESSNDFVRNDCLNKKTRLDTYVKASKLLEKYGIDIDAYIQLGKPFLTTKEDIEDAVKTANFAFDNGFSRVFLMLCNIQPSTLTHFLWERGKFKPPMLWTAIETIKRLPEEKRANAYVKGFNRAVPTPLEFPQNCEKCNGSVTDKLIHWNLTGDFGHIERMPDCDCIQEFKEKIGENSELDLEERVKKTLNYVLDELRKN